MATGVRLYRSSDPGAPALGNGDGALLTVLDAILISGYGAQPAAGWTRPFGGVNRAIYRPKAGTRFFLRVKDDFDAFGTKIALLTGYESMTGVDTGTNPFPTSPDVFRHHKPNGSNGEWLAVVDDRTLYFFNRYLATNRWQGFTFGDFASFLAGDAFNCLLITGAGPHIAAISDTHHTAPVIVTASGGWAIARDHLGAGVLENIGNSDEISYTGDGAKWDSATFNCGRLPRPNPTDGRLYLAPIHLGETKTANKHLRGLLRGGWHWCHTFASAVDQESLLGGGLYNGRVFLMVKDLGDTNGNSVSGVFVVETSDTWEL